MIVVAFVKRLENPLVVKANIKSGSEELNASLITPKKLDIVINGVKILDEFQNVSDINFESANVVDEGGHVVGSNNQGWSCIKLHSKGMFGSMY